MPELLMDSGVLCGTHLSIPIAHAVCSSKSQQMRFISVMCFRAVEKGEKVALSALATRALYNDKPIVMLISLLV